MRKRKNVTPEQIRHRLEHRLRFATIDARKGGIPAKDVFRIVTQAAQDFAYLGADEQTKIGGSK